MQKILNHSKTRWLSLYPCINRLLQNFAGLRSYFLSEKGCPLVLYNFFNDEKSEFWLLFLHAQAHLFYTTIQVIEASDITALEVSFEYSNILEKVRRRLEEVFIPGTASMYLSRIDSLTHARAGAYAKSFYATIIEYLDDWKKRLFSHEPMEIFLLLKKSEYTDFTSACQLGLHLQLDISKGDDNHLFDIYTAMNEFLNVQLENDDKWSEKKLILKWETFLKVVFKVSSKSVNERFVKLLKRIVESVLVYPGSNSDCERLFSLINNYWSDEKSELSLVTLEGAMKVKTFNKTCIEFYDYVKGNSALLQKFLNSAKYESDN